MKPPRDYEIRLKCPKCKRPMNVMRQPDDPKSAVEVHIQCPKCNGGDFDTPRYFDLSGKEVPWQEN